MTQPRPNKGLNLDRIPHLILKLIVFSTSLLSTDIRFLISLSQIDRFVQF